MIAVPEMFGLPLYVPANREAWLEEFAERAAIVEFDGGFPRREAEELAWEMIGPEPGR